jgi:uncharacterized protein YggE
MKGAWALIAAIVIPNVALADDRMIIAKEGETILHVEAIGEVRTPADYIAISVPIQTTGVTAAAARETNQAAIVKFKAGLSTVGIAPAEIISKTPISGFWGNASADEGGEGGIVMTTQMPKRSANSLFEIRVHSLAQLSKVREVLDAQDLTMLGGPRPVLNDDSSAKSAAIGNAITKAKREADAYASTLGLKVVRVARAGNDCTPERNDIEAMMARWSTGIGSGDNMVVTSSSACLDVIAIHNER